MSETPLLDVPLSSKSHQNAKNAAEDYWRIPWQEFEVTLGLQNIFSLRNLNVTSSERARDLLLSCGFDISRPEHMRTFELFYGEALHFIRHVLLSDDERFLYRVPLDIFNLEDPRKLLLLASNRSPRRRYIRIWACAALKVAHALTNLEYSGRLKDIQQAREHIFGRIKSILTINHEDGTTLAKSRNLAVTLAAVDWKEAKTRQSIILKLLHKPDSIMDDVFDYLGVRFVVPNETEIPRLLRLLIETDIIIPHQVISSRTRNSLLNFSISKRLHGISTDLLSTDLVTPLEFNDMCKKIPWATAGIIDENSKRTNSFTSQFYKSLQLTVRHLVRTPNPAYMVIDSLSSQLRHYRGMDRDDPWLAGMIPPEITRYFPIEIQIMDESSYDLSRFGPASHERYKAAQLKGVRQRILGSMLYLTEDKLASQDV